jgi:hypothetical protein
LSYAPPLEEAYRLVRRFLSSLAWAERGHLREIGASGGTTQSGSARAPWRGSSIRGSVRITFLRQLTQERDELSRYIAKRLGSTASRIGSLPFYKVVNILYERGPDETRGSTASSISWTIY